MYEDSRQALRAYWWAKSVFESEGLSSGPTVLRGINALRSGWVYVPRNRRIKIGVLFGIYKDMEL